MELESVDIKSESPSENDESTEDLEFIKGVKVGDKKSKKEKHDREKSEDLKNKLILEEVTKLSLP